MQDRLAEIKARFDDVNESCIRFVGRQFGKTYVGKLSACVQDIPWLIEHVELLQTYQDSLTADLHTLMDKHCELDVRATSMQAVVDAAQEVLENSIKNEYTGMDLPHKWVIDKLGGPLRELDREPKA